MESPTAGLRYETLVRALTARARSIEEQRQWTHLIGVLVRVLPPEQVAAAYRAAHNVA